MILNGYNKLFAIGLSRTGTTSLTKYLNDNGISSIHYPNPNQLYNLQYKAATDITVSDQFERLDKAYPGSLFVYTYRNKESWMKSMEKYLSPSRPHKLIQSGWRVEIRTRMYGASLFDQELYSKSFDKYDQRVRKYFEGRDDFLEINIVGGDTTEALDKFLGLSKSPGKFPKENKL
jgi:hypothetical protein